MSEGEPPAPIEGEFQDRLVGITADCAQLLDFQSSDANWAQRIERHLQVKDADESAIVVMRPRGLRVSEQNLAVDGQPMSAALFDFGLYAFHRAAQGAALSCDWSHVRNPHEARLWHDVLAFAEQHLGLPAGSIKAAVIDRPGV